MGGKRESKLKTPSKKVSKSTKVEEMICYHCDKEIMNASEVVFKPISRYGKNGRTSLVNRMFHFKCLNEYIDKATDFDFRASEETDWDKVYQYFRKEYMQTDQSLETHAVRRLLGLRLGKYYPDGNNTRILDRGYPFSTIYKAMIIAKFKAKAYASKVQFTDYNHRVNTYLKFIASEVVDVQMRLDEVERNNEALKKAIEKKEKENVQYVDYLAERIEDNKNAKVERNEDVQQKGLVESLWGIDIDDEDF